MQVNEDRWSAQRIENKSGPSLTCQPHLGFRANLRLVGGSPCPPPTLCCPYFGDQLERKWKSSQTEKGSLPRSFSPGRAGGKRWHGSNLD